MNKLKEPAAAAVVTTTHLPVLWLAGLSPRPDPGSSVKASSISFAVLHTATCGCTSLLSWCYANTHA